MKNTEDLVSVTLQWDEMQAFSSPFIQGFFFSVICVNINSFCYIRRQMDSTEKRQLETQKKTENKLWAKGCAGEGSDNSYWESVSKQDTQRTWSGEIKAVGTIDNILVIYDLERGLLFLFVLPQVRERLRWWTGRKEHNVTKNSWTSFSSAKGILRKMRFLSRNISEE